MKNYEQSKQMEISRFMAELEHIRLKVPSLRLMQLLYNVGALGEMEQIDGVPYIKDPFYIKDHVILHKLQKFNDRLVADEKQKAQTELAIDGQIDWEEVKKTPLYVPAKRVPIDSAKYIMYKGDRDFNGTTLPVFFYLHIPYCANEENTFGIDFVPNEYIPKEWNKHLAGCTCYDNGIYAVDLEYVSRNIANPD